MRRRLDRILALVLEGRHAALSSAFTWCRTPQGHGYWQDRYEGRVPISDDDRGFLIRMANERRL